MLSVALAGSALAGSGCAGSGDASGLVPLVRSDAARIRIREFADLPRGGPSFPYTPSAITTGPDGNLWVTEVIDQDYGENDVVAVAPTGKRVHTYKFVGSLSPGSELYDIAVGPDRALWMPDVLNEQIVRMTTSGSFTTYRLHNYAVPFDIVEGPDKALWFTVRQINAGMIGRITVKGDVTLYRVGNLVGDIAAGPDGALWFTEYDANQIGRITTRGKIAEYGGITAGPASIAPGPDGALWFTEPAGGRIGRIATSGKVTEYSRGISAMEEPRDIAAGSDGNMWFTEYVYDNYAISQSKIGRITMGGKITEFSRGVDPGSGPDAITAGPDGNEWFVTTTDKSGRVSL